MGASLLRAFFKPVLLLLPKEHRSLLPYPTPRPAMPATEDGDVDLFLLLSGSPVTHIVSRE